jgi:hypothetical protein
MFATEVLMSAEDVKEKVEKQDPDIELSEEDQHDIELFIHNSQTYCDKVYGKTYCDEDVAELRKEITETNAAVKKVRNEWGLT